MPDITIDCTDGAYSVKVLTPEEADRLQEQDGDTYYVEDAVVRAWERHLDEHRAFAALWRSLENERVVRRLADDAVGAVDSHSRALGEVLK